jgi:hypothetical protein
VQAGLQAMRRAERVRLKHMPVIQAAQPYRRWAVAADHVLPIAHLAPALPCTPPSPSACSAVREPGGV